MAGSDIVQQGDSVILYFSITNLVLVPCVKPEGTTHNSAGYFLHSDIIGKAFGDKVEPHHKSETPRSLYILRVTPELFTLSIPHRTQIIYHADISAIMMGLNILPGSTVAEAGTGSASLSFSFAYSLAPSGKLHTFEVDSVRAQQNRELLEHVTPKGVVTLEERDVIKQGFPPELSVDAVFLDLPSPWLAVGNARKILRPNGKLCTFSPSIEQVTKNTSAMRFEGFHEIKTVEVMLKPWGLDLPKQIGEKRKRCRKGQSFQLPMRGHTSYLTFAIRQLDDEAQYPKPILSLAKVTRLASSRAKTEQEPVKEENKDILPVSLEM